MRAPTRTAAATAAALGCLLLLSGCTGAEQREREQKLEKELDELRAVNGDLLAAALRPEAEEAFEQNGHPVAGKLSCAPGTESDAEPGQDVTVECTGTGKDDEKLTLTGTLDPRRVAEQEDDDYGLPGRFVGRLDGEELFTSTCFNCKAG